MQFLVNYSWRIAFEKTSDDVAAAAPSTRDSHLNNSFHFIASVHRLISTSRLMMAYGLGRNIALFQTLL